MNAYQILGIMSHIDNEMDEHSANEKIMNKVKTIVLSSIEQINQIINSNDISTEEKVKKSYSFIYENYRCREKKSI